MFKWTFRKEKYYASRISFGDNEWADALDGKSVILPYDREYDDEGFHIAGRWPKVTAEYCGRAVQWSVDQLWCDIEEVSD